MVVLPCPEVTWERPFNTHRRTCPPGRSVFLGDHGILESTPAKGYLQVVSLHQSIQKDRFGIGLAKLRGMIVGGQSSSVSSGKRKCSQET